MPDRTVVITGAKRTPIGSLQGHFATVPADELGAAAIKGALAEAGLEPDVDFKVRYFDVLVGKHGDHILLAPPFIIEDNQLDELVDKLSGAIAAVI